MTYELAKALKEAGFPQKNVFPCEICGGKTDCAITQHENSKPAYQPTLSELIEACGGKRGDLHFNLAFGFDGSWCASYGKVIEYDDSDNYVASSLESGPTPEQAVALLWLALNKKT